MTMRSMFLLIAVVLLGGCAAMEQADDDMHRVVIQVSTDDARTQKIAINNAVNIQRALGAGNVQIEVVAYGPGLSILTGKSKQAVRIKSLAVDDDFQFSACSNTMRKVKKKKGKLPKLVEGVVVVPAGVTRIMELQEQGYSYLRP